MQQVAKSQQSVKQINRSLNSWRETLQSLDTKLASTCANKEELERWNLLSQSQWQLHLEVNIYKAFLFSLSAAAAAASLNCQEARCSALGRCLAPIEMARMKSPFHGKANNNRMRCCCCDSRFSSLFQIIFSFWNCYTNSS